MCWRRLIERAETTIVALNALKGASCFRRTKACYQWGKEILLRVAHRTLAKDDQLSGERHRAMEWSVAQQMELCFISPRDLSVGHVTTCPSEMTRRYPWSHGQLGWGLWILKAYTFFFFITDLIELHMTVHWTNVNIYTFSLTLQLYRVGA